MPRTFLAVGDHRQWCVSATPSFRPYKLATMPVVGYGGPCPPCLLQVPLVAAGSLSGGTAGGVFSLSKEQQLSDSDLPWTLEGVTPGWQGPSGHTLVPPMNFLMPFQGACSLLLLTPLRTMEGAEVICSYIPIFQMTHLRTRGQSHLPEVT